MNIFKSPRLESFHCLGRKCPDSCCQNWAIRVDSDSVRRYEELPPSPLRDRIKSALDTASNGESSFRTENGHCPFLNEKKLCDLQRELNHDSLPQICREYPRALSVSPKNSNAVAYLDMGCPEAACSILVDPQEILPENIESLHKVWSILKLDLTESERIGKIAESLGIEHYPNMDIFEDAAKIVRRPLTVEMNKSTFGRQMAVASAPMFFSTVIEPEWPPDEGQNLFEYALEYMQDFESENPQMIRRYAQHAAMEEGLMLSGESPYLQFGRFYARLLLFRILVMGQILIEEPFTPADYLRFCCQFERLLPSTGLLARVSQNIAVCLD